MAEIDNPPQSGKDRPLVLFLYANQYADLFGAMARELRESDGIDSALAVLDRNTLPDPAVYDFRQDDFAEIIDLAREITPRRREEMPAGAALAAAALAFERKVGVPVNELIRADRHAGIGFVLGGCYPRSRYGMSVDYDQAVDIVLRTAARTQALIAKRKPIAVIGSPADIARSTLVAVAEQAGIPLRIPSASFANVRFQWKVNKYYWPANLAENFVQVLAKTPRRPEDREIAADVPDTDRTRYARRSIEQSIWLRTLFDQMYRSIRREVGHFVKRRNPIYGRPLLRDDMRMLVRLWIEKRRALRQRPVIETLKDRAPYIFYPLTVEPELTLQCEAPMCDNQLALIDVLAKTAPGGWKVVVKEHPGFTTPRPDGFYDRIRQYPNVVLAAPYESGEALASRARVVAVVTGSLGFQAALAGVPVLAFSPNWFGRLLPHVLYANSYDGTREALVAVAEDKLPPVEERRRSSRALLEALELDSIALQSLDVLRERATGRPVPQPDLRAICDSLLDSLSMPPERAIVPFARPGRVDGRKPADNADGPLRRASRPQ